MEILRQGSREKIREWEIKHKKIYVLTCEKCDCEFEVEQGDKEIQYSQRDDEVWVKCPFCSYIIDIK